MISYIPQMAKLNTFSHIYQQNFSWLSWHIQGIIYLGSHRSLRLNLTHVRIKVKMPRKSLRINQKQAYDACIYQTIIVWGSLGWGGPRGFWPAKAGSLQRCIKAMANILSIRYNLLNLYVI